MSDNEETHHPQDPETADKNEESLLARHRKEKKELQAKIQSLKKAKVDKKKKKEQQDEIARLEADLESRHAEELNRFNAMRISTDPPAPIVDVNNEGGDGSGDDESGGKTVRISKAQRRREKKSQEDKERQAQIKAEEALQKDSPRILEDRKFTELLSKRGLVSFPVPADGDCLYNAIKHQLSRIGIFEHDTADLRQLAADYIEDNKDSIIFYMTNPDTGDILNDEEFRKYCHQVRNTKTWGGEIEIKALSSSLKCPIEIIQASGSSVIHGENMQPSRKLILTYHRHMYRLGEHYNSTIAPVAAKEDEGLNEDDG
ncbi:deubiquitinase OTUD6B [Uranotaenia lowii]|uniref:deubiquitinase OTUD6B n=1 Tax=Uranotaenia lowii TaxID=190385 RepID=UPI00247A860B|nr:deubiquitinase OTUD6B [Uranotaenia lowii]XP_055610731.1 deubiquitinase OTUD6B [Uranotaenia lowii]XP_055610737.1 deubiquitinase OTUD6B [Uranotaenia lowii]